MATSLKQRLKRIVLPSQPKVRRLPWGLGRGLKFEIDFAHQTQLYFGRYETELNAVIRRLAVTGRDSFDIGAQFGYDALVLARLTGARVVTVECYEPTLELLHRNVAANEDLAERVTIVAAFVGDAAGLDGEGGFAERSVKWHREISGTPMTTIDELALAHFRPGLIKVDIEGAEMEALRGAERVIREDHPDWLIETHSEALEQQCIALLAEAGYKIDTITPKRVEHRDARNSWIVATT